MNTRALNTWVFALLFLSVVIAGFAIRVTRLDQRPMHTDEAVHAVKLGILLDSGSYTYDPHEYHGPTLYYPAIPLIRLSGARSYIDIVNEIPLRLVPVIFGTGLIILLLLVHDGLGKSAVLCAGLLTAFSPAMVFYSRYYIQEMLLVFFTFGAIAAGWRYARTRALPWALLSGACLGLMHATKETCVIAWVSILGSMFLTHLYSRRLDNKNTISPQSDPGQSKHPLKVHIAGAAAVAVIVSVLCLTALMTNPKAAIDSILTYVQYIQRAGTIDAAEIHRHPWHYYLGTLAYAKYAPGPSWSEGLILFLAIIGIASSLMRNSEKTNSTVSFTRFLTFYTLLMTIIYSVIPYKTPWCMLGFLHGLILLAGVGAVTIYTKLPNRFLKIAAVVLFALGTYHLGCQAYRSAFVYHADTRNPYVYAHTSTDLPKLAKCVEQIANVHKDKQEMIVKVLAKDSDYWPLPWYLRRFKNTGYWDSIPDNPDAPLIIVSIDMEEELKAKLKDKYQTEYYGLRPNVLLLAYIRTDLWEAFISEISQ